MKGASLFLIVLLLLFAVPAMAVQAQGNTGVELSATSILTFEEVNIDFLDSQVSELVYIEAECLLPDDKKYIPLLEFSENKKSHSNNLVVNNGHTNMRKRRIKSGRH